MAIVPVALGALAALGVPAAASPATTSSVGIDPGGAGRATGAGPAGIVDLGVTAIDAVIAGDWFVALVLEDVDLNGDGDRNDAVVHAFQLSTGIVRNLGLAAADATTDGDCVVIAVDEARQGARDLNGNGRADDLVVHVHDLARNTTSNVGVAVQRASLLRTSENMTAISKDAILIAVDEASQGRDLDGDGDLLDVVVHVRERATGTLRNLGLATCLFPSFFAGLAGDESVLAFAASEADLGGVDLNGDGDGGDAVLFSLRGGEPVNHGLAIHPVFDVVDGMLVFLVDEAAQGATDFNGDGDADDHVFHSASATGVRDFGLAGFPAAFPGFAEFDLLAAPGSSTVVLRVPEAAQGRDLNGDGDTGDSVPFVLDLARGRASSTGLAAFATALGSRGRGAGAGAERNALVLSVLESEQGAADLNHDGDSDDAVAFVYDARSGRATDLGVAVQRDGATLFPDASGRGFSMLKLDERSSGEDANGDGDADDVVVSVLDAARRRVESLGIATLRYDSNLLGGFLEADDRYGLFPASEAEQGADLNGDGDTSDHVLFVHDDRGTGRPINTSIALLSATEPVARDGDRAVVIGADRRLFLIDLPELR